MNNDYGNYYSQHQPPLPPAAGAVTAPTSYGAPQGSLPPSQPYNAANPAANPAASTGAPLYPAAYQHPYTMPSAYYGQQYPVSQAQSHQPNLMAVSSGVNNGAPVYPIVSYPSAPGSSQYGTLRSSQAPAGPAPISGPSVTTPPSQTTGQTIPMGNGPTPPTSATPAHTGYGTAPYCQPATVNGQTNARKYIKD